MCASFFFICYLRFFRYFSSFFAWLGAAAELVYRLFLDVSR